MSVPASASASASAPVTDAEVAAWNAQPLHTWTRQELCERLRTEEYEREVSLASRVRASVLAFIEAHEIGGTGIAEFCRTVRDLDGASLLAAIAAWLPRDYARVSQAQVGAKHHIHIMIEPSRLLYVYLSHVFECLTSFLLLAITCA
jgi:hypothetical protein